MQVRNALVIERVGDGVKITIVKDGERGGYLWCPLPLNQVALMWLNRQCPRLDRRQSVRSIVASAMENAIAALARRLDAPPAHPGERCTSCGHYPNACECPCCIGAEDRGFVTASGQALRAGFSVHSTERAGETPAVERTITQVDRERRTITFGEAPHEDRPAK